MSETVTKLLPKLLSSEHKCKQTKCKQMSEEFENMKKFVLFSNQMNIRYLNLINGSDNFAGDEKDRYRIERQSLFLKIDSEVKTIGATIGEIISGNNDFISKQKSAKVVCDLCQKTFSSNLMTTHLSEHLDRIFGRKTSDERHNINENLNQTNTRTERYSNQNSEELSQLLCPNIEIKDEPPFDVHSDEDNYSPNISASSDEEEVHSEEEMLPKRRSKRKTIDRITPRKRGRPKKSVDSYKSSESRLYCDECGLAFKSKQRLTIHLKSGHKKVDKIVNNECHLCDFKSFIKKAFRNHMMSEHNIDPEVERKFECTWNGCKWKFSYVSSLQNHMNNHRKEYPHKCEWPGCSRQFKGECHLKEHMNVHTGAKPFQCHWPGCDRGFGQKSNLRSHMLTHDKSLPRKHVCHYPECGRSYEKKKLLREHIFNVHEQDNKPYRCPHPGCDSTFVSEYNLRLHVGNIHNENRVKHECKHDGCQRSYYDIDKLERHMGKPHGKRKKEEKRKKERERKERTLKPKKKYVPKVTNTQCDWPGCEFVVKYSYMLKEHKARTHTLEKRLKCDYPGCDFRAVRNYDLKCHVLKHTGETPFPCTYPHCGQRYKSQRALDTHYTRNHP